MGGYRLVIALFHGVLSVATVLGARHAHMLAPNQQLVPVSGWPAVNAIAHIPDDGTPMDPLTVNAPPPPRYDANGNEIGLAGIELATQQFSRPAMIQQAAREITATRHPTSAVELEGNVMSSLEMDGGGRIPHYNRFTSFLQSRSAEAMRLAHEDESCSCTLGGYCYKKGSCVAIAMGWVALMLIVILIFAWVLQFVISIPTEWVVVRRLKGFSAAAKQTDNNATQVEGSATYNSDRLLAVGAENYL